MQAKSRFTQIVEVSDKLGHLIEMSSGAFCVFLFAIMIFVALLGIFFRYIMLNPFQWSEELARYLMAALSFLAINIALRRKQHIAIQLLTTKLSKLSDKIPKVLDYFVDLLIGLFLIVLVKQGYTMATQTFIETSTLHISMFWPYITVPLGAFLTLLQLVLIMIKKIISEFAPISNEI